MNPANESQRETPIIPEDIRETFWGEGIWGYLLGCLRKVWSIISRLFGFSEPQRLSLSKIQKKLLQPKLEKETAQYSYQNVQQAIQSVRSVLGDLKRFRGCKKPEGFGQAKRAVETRIKDLKAIIRKSESLQGDEKASLFQELEQEDHRISSRENEIDNGTYIFQNVKEANVGGVVYTGLENQSEFGYQNTAIQFLFAIEEIRYLLEKNQLRQRFAEQLEQETKKVFDQLQAERTSEPDSPISQNVWIDFIKEAISKEKNDKEMQNYLEHYCENSYLSAIEEKIDRIIEQNEELSTFIRKRSTYFALIAFYQKYSRGDGSLSKELSDLHNLGVEEQQNPSKFLLSLLSSLDFSLPQPHRKKNFMLEASPFKGSDQRGIEDEQADREESSFRYFSIEKILEKTMQMVVFDEAPKSFPLSVKRSLETQAEGGRQSLDGFFDSSGRPKRIEVHMNTTTGSLKAYYRLSVVMIHEKESIESDRYYTYKIHEDGRVLKLDSSVSTVRVDTKAYDTHEGTRIVDVQTDISENGCVYFFRRIGRVELIDEGVVEYKENEPYLLP